jgi:hypothetical protein
MNKNLKAGLITVGVMAALIAAGLYAPELLGVAILILIPALIYLIIKIAL